MSVGWDLLVADPKAELPWRSWNPGRWISGWQTILVTFISLGVFPGLSLGGLLPGRSGMPLDEPLSLVATAQDIVAKLWRSGCD